MIRTPIRAMHGLYRFWRQFGSDRIVTDLPRILRQAADGERRIAQQESGPRRFDLINMAIERRGYQTYLEIGVRDPVDCFERVRVARKWSVDPGIEFRSNPVDFAMTSDTFFEMCDRATPKDCPSQWDVIFIDGLHRAEQVARDIVNSSRYLRPGGMIFLHDCLPPSESFARERFEWALESGMCWSGTSWKALAHYLQEGPWRAFIVPTDWGVGIIDSEHDADPGSRPGPNQFFEFDMFVRGLRPNIHLLSIEDFFASL
jgi:hypothetical protein